jgi:ABC-type transport system involved in multi-copper enzyme maturation permease subunit
LHASKPSFFGLVRGEIFKINRQWATWIMLVFLVGIIALPYLLSLTVSSLKDTLNADALGYLTTRTANYLGLFRAFSGIILVIMTATVIGREYSLGTIRIVLARGVGRMQLLLAKLTAVLVWAFFLLIIGLALNALLTTLLVTISTGNLNAFNALTSTYWHDNWIYVLTICFNMVVTILMAAALSVLGRSLAFGLSAALVFFPLDNILVEILALAYRLTHNDFWLHVSAYMLGPNLNVMAGAVTKHDGWGFGAPPMDTVDGTHTLVVALVYALIFALVAFVLIGKRDVKE